MFGGEVFYTEEFGNHRSFIRIISGFVVTSIAEKEYHNGQKHGNSGDTPSQTKRDILSKQQNVPLKQREDGIYIFLKTERICSYTVPDIEI